MTTQILVATGVLFVVLVLVALIILAARLAGRVRKAKAPEPPAEDPAAAFRARYDALCMLHEVPGNAMEVGVAKADGPAARYHCWTKGSELLFFPAWDSLLDERLLEIWRMPTEGIVCHATQQGLPGRFTVLQYRAGDEILSLAFPEDASRVFAALLPEKDLSHLLEGMYPKSSRNIQDIKESFVSLKELRGEDLITEDEYAAKKKEMLLTM
jgi:hypothetical protein